MHFAAQYILQCKLQKRWLDSLPAPTKDPATGDLTSTTYRDSTPPVFTTYTRLGQPDTITDASGTRTFSYAPEDAFPTGEPKQRGAAETDHATAWPRRGEGAGRRRLNQLQNANLQRTTDSALLPGRQYHYQYDSTGNRLTASQGDTTNAAQHPQSINYQPSTLNQYTGLTHSAYGVLWPATNVIRIDVSSLTPGLTEGKLPSW